MSRELLICVYHIGNNTDKSDDFIQPFDVTSSNVIEWINHLDFVRISWNFRSWYNLSQNKMIRIDYVVSSLNCQIKLIHIEETILRITNSINSIPKLELSPLEKPCFDQSYFPERIGL